MSATGIFAAAQATLVASLQGLGLAVVVRLVADVLRRVFWLPHACPLARIAAA